MIKNDANAEQLFAFVTRYLRCEQLRRWRSRRRNHERPRGELIVEGLIVCRLLVEW